MGPARLGYEFHALVQVHYWGTVALGLLRGSLCFVMSVLMVITANASFWTHGRDWHQAHIGGWINFAATVGWIRVCSEELDTLEGIWGLAMRRKF